MDALDIVRVLRRRWTFTAAGAAVLAVLVGAVVFLVPQQYKVTAISLVTPTSNTNVLNPYTSADKSQPQMAALLVTVLTAPQTADEYTTSGATGAIQVTNGNGATDTSQLDSPFITITVTDKSAIGAVRSAQIVFRRAVSELKNRQDAAKVDPTQRLTLTEVLPATEATTTRASQFRAIGLVAALGLVLGVLGIVVADRVLNRRRSQDAADDGFVLTLAEKPDMPEIPPVVKNPVVNSTVVNRPSVNSTVVDSTVNGVVPPVLERRQGVLPEQETTMVVPPVVRDESPTIQFRPVRAKNDRGGEKP